MATTVFSTQMLEFRGGRLSVEGGDGKEVVVNRLDAIASLGSACIDNEECYLISKLNRTLGIVYHEHQARV